MSCEHNWDQSGDLEVLEENSMELIFNEREYCDKCFIVKIMKMRGLKDSDEHIFKTEKLEEIIRPQTPQEKENAAPQ